MKRILSLITMVSLIFSSCGLTDAKNSSKINKRTSAQIMFDKIISSLDDKNADELKSLFSPNALSKTTNIDNQIENLFELYQGKFVSNSHFSAGASSSSRENGKYVYLTIGPRIEEIVTSEATYSLSFNSIVVDNENPNDEGLWGIWLRLKDGDKVVKEAQVGIPYLGSSK